MNSDRDHVEIILTTFMSALTYFGSKLFASIELFAKWLEHKQKS